MKYQRQCNLCRCTGLTDVFAEVLSPCLLATAAADTTPPLPQELINLDMAVNIYKGGQWGHLR